MREQYGIPPLLLQVNLQHPSLRLHAHVGKLDGLHSVSINLSYRITLVPLIRDRENVPIDMRGHDAVSRTAG